VERIVGVFPMSDQHVMRARFAKTFGYIISQRLIPRRDASGRVAVFEILKSTLRTREYVHHGETEGKSLVDAMRDGSTEGMQCFDDEIEKLARANVIDLETAYSYSTNPGNLRLQLADLLEQQSIDPSAGANIPSKPGAAEKHAIPTDPELEITR